MQAIEPVLRSWEPLRFPSRSQPLVRATNLILQRANSLPVSLADRPWFLTLTAAFDSNSPGLPEEIPASTWRLDVLWGDAPFQFYLPARAAQAWLAEGFPELDFPDLPEPFSAAILEAAARTLLPSLSGVGRGELRVVRIERAGNATYRQEATWRLQLKSGSPGADFTIDGWLSATRDAVLHLASCLEDCPVTPGPILPDHLPMVLRAEVGFTWMTPEEWSGLRPGDAILVERPLLAPDGELWLTCGPLVLRARPEAGQLFVTASWQQGGSALDHFEEDDLYAGPLDNLRRVPLRVAFDVGELRLTVAEVEALQVGQALDLGRPLSEAVQVRIHGVRVGLGELIDIDGRLGVVLRSLGTQDLGDLPWERADAATDMAPGQTVPPMGGAGGGQSGSSDGLDDLPDLPELPPPEV